MARRESREITRHLAPHGEEGDRDRIGRLPAGARRRVMLWLDRWPEAPVRRGDVAPAIHAAGTAERLVQNQHRQGADADREWAYARCGASGHRVREGERPL